MNLLLAALLLLQEKTAEQLVEQLRSDQPDQRDAAVRELLRLGESSVSALEKATKDKDPEVALRARWAIRVVNPASSREAIQNIEEAISKARSVRVVFEGETHRLDKDTGEDFKTTFAGEVFLKKGNRAYYSMKRVAEFKHDPAECILISDGSQVHGGGGVLPSRVETPEDLQSSLSIAVARTGPCASSEVVWDILGFNIRHENTGKMSETLQLSAFSPLADDGESKVLGYTLASTKYGTTGKVQLWYDPKTYRLIKRKLTNSGRNTTITETFKEFTLNADIPDEKFKLPEEKK
jgi:outer membrane lipoprotein-sorting protein